MLTAILLLLIVTLGAAALHYYFVHSKIPEVPYQDESIQLRTMQSESERKELHEAQSIISAIRNRRESLHERLSRKNSFEEASGDFINLKNVKLSRALSCESFDENSDEESNEYSRRNSTYGMGSASFLPHEIPDIKTWIKNPTDFFRLRSGSEEIGPEGKPWQPTDSAFTTELPVTQPQLLISISYLPTAERLSIVIVKAKLPMHLQTSLKFICAKAHIVDDRTGKRFNKKKTGLKAMEFFARSACAVSTINELMIFRLPINMLSVITVKISCFGYGPSAGNGLNGSDGSIATGEPLLRPPAAAATGGPDHHQALISKRRSSFSHRKEFPACVSLGFVDLGSNSSHSTAVTQFTTMMTNMRKPVTCWHVLQPKVTKRKSFAEPSLRRYSAYNSSSNGQPEDRMLHRAAAPIQPILQPDVSQIQYYPSAGPYSSTTQALHHLPVYTSTPVDPSSYHYETSSNMFVNS